MVRAVTWPSAQVTPNQSHTFGDSSQPRWSFQWGPSVAWKKSLKAEHSALGTSFTLSQKVLGELHAARDNPIPSETSARRSDIRSTLGSCRGILPDDF